MGVLSDELEDMGYEPTDKESPFDDDGMLWTKGYELVCDETAVVIRKDNGESFFQRQRNGERKIYRYQNSENVKLAGGYTGSYSWGEEDGEFVYDGDY